jgi:DNA-binding transcriptional regulator PaaX
MPVVLLFPPWDGSSGRRMAIRYPLEDLGINAKKMLTFVETLVGRGRLGENEDGSIQFRLSDETRARFDEAFDRAVKAHGGEKEAQGIWECGGWQ